MKAQQRVVEFPNEGFSVLDGNVYCNNCNCSVSWVHKSDIVKHIQTDKHKNGKKMRTLEAGPSKSESISRPAKRQRCMSDIVSASQKKTELIADLITIFAVADIPLQKVDAIRPFLRKHVPNGGNIPSSSQLREIHLPRLMPEIESAVSKLMKDTSSVNVILDETTDNTSRVVLDILFKIPVREKPILAQTFLFDAHVNHSLLAQSVVDTLGKYQVPLTRGVVDSLVGDGASYIGKAYKEILQPLMPDLINVWCMSHQLNLIGEKWRDHPNNSLMTKYLALMNSLFSRSTGEFNSLLLRYLIVHFTVIFHMTL